LAAAVDDVYVKDREKLATGEHFYAKTDIF